MGTARHGRAVGHRSARQEGNTELVDVDRGPCTGDCVTLTISALRWSAYVVTAAAGFVAGLSDTVPMGLIILALVVAIWAGLVAWAWRLGQGK